MDDIAAFYDRHPYPPPVENLDDHAAAWADPARRRLYHHVLWPTLPYRDDPAILVAGCGTAQAARYAIRYPDARVVGIDVSPTSIDATRRLVEHHGLDNLELELLAIEDAGQLGSPFDQIVCTGVIHHLADPAVGLRTLRDVLAPDGALQLMVYATYGRTGVAIIQEYCRRLGVGPTGPEIADLVATLRELPLGHPLGHLLRDTPDFHDDDALADALLNPRERSYTVPELLAFLEGADLRFGRWLRQAPYLPQCGALTEVPHGARIAAMSPPDQYAAVELYRGTITRHSVIAHRDDAPLPDPAVRWDDDTWRSFVPIPSPSVVVVEERLPPGAAAALINREHTDRDLVLFVDDDERRLFEAIDGVRTLGEIDGATAAFFERLWQHDHVVIDASRGPGSTAR